MRLHGIGRGSRVGLLLPNSPYYVVAFLAALRCGATVVHFSSLLAEFELAAQLDDSRVENLITLMSPACSAAARACRGRADCGG